MGPFEVFSGQTQNTRWLTSGLLRKLEDGVQWRMVAALPPWLKMKLQNCQRSRSSANGLWMMFNSVTCPFRIILLSKSTLVSIYLTLQDGTQPSVSVKHNAQLLNA